MASSEQPIVLYHYPYSPFARRISWYLALRGIPYMQCLQPPIMPRPDLSEELGVQYRRIPVLTIGRDVYLDTRLILSKLEEAHPSVPKLGASEPQSKGVQRLLAALTLDTGMFFAAMSLLPRDLPALKDPKFQKDRASFISGPPAGGWLSRADAVNKIRDAMELLETTLLADGRDWILQTDKPSLADIEAIWPFHWLITLPGSPALPANQVSAELFPRVFAWIQRFDKAVGAAGSSGPKPRKLKGKEAAQLILASRHNEDYTGAELTAADGEGLTRGSMVRLWPTDTGSGHRDSGKLVHMDQAEIVIENLRGVRIHAPRQGFKVRAEAGL
ncbi:hypothetical protein MGG_15837 [Pyricularia oryzae 70-15]|uniref:GST N-terminal domain-containing protein n=3 Tax=Pyricularia oryzae TaxID=318829 RepID=G4MZM5_PYRO7|nr:uncharacterized protein MGG_15837 [Pyricularia oryzae 70-15]EHA55389.1 hypothetical protein MGG_15837 [Pyricularia oryzae 70-15]